MQQTQAASRGKHGDITQVALHPLLTSEHTGCGQRLATGTTGFCPLARKTSQVHAADRHNTRG